MSWTAVVERARSPAGRIRNTGILILAALAAILWWEPPFLERLQTAWFDSYQARAPRQIESLPVVIVEVDDRSIARLGQWPWPRTQLARLIEDIARDKPLAIGLDFVMTEPDRLSPQRLLEHVGAVDPALAARIATWPSNDNELARAFAAAPIVLSVVGRVDADGSVLRAAPMMVRETSSTAVPTHPDVMKFGSVTGNLDQLDSAAAGRGLISISPAEAVIRRVPLVFDINGTLAPSLALELVRVAVGAQAFRVTTDRGVVTAVTVGAYTARTERDGSLRPYYSRAIRGRFVSAVDVMEGAVAPKQFADRLVLVAATGVGLVDSQNTPLGEKMFGTEIHAQLVENVLQGTWLERPAWGRPLELALFVLLGALLIYATPRWSPRGSLLLAAACIVLPALAGFAAFLARRWLLDAATPAVGLVVLFIILLLLTLREATRTRQSLQRQVTASRERAARVAGEFEAAQRIQIGMLPSADLLRDDGRVELAAAMTPAREVGGDLYDYFRLDNRRLFFLIGDVAGKGLSASIFMAVSKALYKSMALRSHELDAGALMSMANVEVSRDNPESLFVTAFAGILDLETGELAYCNAGHENPYVLHAGDGAIARIADGDGPPLCAIDGYTYHGSERRLAPGDVLCLVTDGVTDASNTSGEAYGSKRTLACLARFAGKHPAASDIVAALRADVAAHAGGAEPADDLTVLALRWTGSYLT